MNPVSSNEIPSPPKGEIVEQIEITDVDYFNAANDATFRLTGLKIEQHYTVFGRENYTIDAIGDSNDLIRAQYYLAKAIPSEIPWKLSEKCRWKTIEEAKLMINAKKSVIEQEFIVMLDHFDKIIRNDNELFSMERLQSTWIYPVGDVLIINNPHVTKQEFDEEKKRCPENIWILKCSGIYVEPEELTQVELKLIDRRGWWRRNLPFFFDWSSPQKKMKELNKSFDNYNKGKHIDLQETEAMFSKAQIFFGEEVEKHPEDRVAMFQVCLALYFNRVMIHLKAKKQPASK